MPSFGGGFCIFNDFRELSFCGPIGHCLLRLNIFSGREKTTKILKVKSKKTEKDDEEYYLCF